MWDGFEVPNDPLPAKLRHGDTVRVLYDGDELSRQGAFLPECRDSLGNKYALNGWLRIDPETHALIFQDGPGEGMRPPHD